MRVSASDQFGFNAAQALVDFDERSGTDLCGLNRFEKVLDIAGWGSVTKQYFRAVLNARPE